MDCINVSDARKNLYNLIDKVAEVHEPTLIKGKRNSAILVSNEDWEDIQETLFVVQNKDLYASILKSMNEPFEKCSNKLDW